LDRTNLFNPTPAKGDFEATNPCGEQPLLAYESCNLGSINLGKLVLHGSGEPEVNWARLAELVDLSVRFLDNVIDSNHYPVPACETITRSNRKIGLGVMGFADLLLELKIPYGSPESASLGEAIMAFIDRRAKSASMSLAQEKGAFEGARSSLWSRLGYPAMRNATVSTVAPTGTISLLASASSGIEPIFAAEIQRNVLGGKKLIEMHAAVARELKRAGKQRPEELGPSWRPARTLSVSEHLLIQGAFQRHSDSAVSKTVNLPRSASRDDVARAYWMAESVGCKGITIYRDQSLAAQVLEDAPPSSGQGCDLCVD
jgi:ribonucleoside-diphosphate reductase alpha chain